MPVIWTNKEQHPSHNQMPIVHGIDFSNENPPRYKVWGKVVEGPTHIKHEEIMNTADYARIEQRRNEVHQKICTDYAHWHNEDQRNKACMHDVDMIIANIRNIRDNGTQEAKNLLASFLKGN